MPGDALKKANRLLAKEIHKKYQESGLSLADLALKCGFPDGRKDAPRFQMYFDGRRGFSFPMAIDLANSLGIDLGVIQRKIERKPRTKSQKIKRQYAVSQRGMGKFKE